MSNQKIIEEVQHWLETIVIALNFCPFAKGPLMTGGLQFSVTKAETEENLLQVLQQSLEQLDKSDKIETMLLIHPHVLQDFGQYNQFLGRAETLLSEQGWEGIYQIASFHPNYQFAGTQPDDVENFTNRAPYPLLHLLSEKSVEKALANYPDPNQIPARNIACLEAMSTEKLKKIFS